VCTTVALRKRRPAAPAQPPVRQLDLERAVDRCRIVAVEERQRLQRGDARHEAREADVRWGAVLGRDGELHGQRRPGVIAVEALQVGAAQAARHTRQGKRADGAMVGPGLHDQVRSA